MRIVFLCPVCEAPNRQQPTQASRTLHCDCCTWRREIPADDFSGERPLKCLCCGNPDLWRQKDFPQALGLLMAATGAILSIIAWAWYEPLLALGILLVFAAIDMALFVLMPDVLVCYRCRARHRTPDMDDAHPRFDLELNERYRQEGLRLAEAAKPESESADTAEATRSEAAAPQPASSEPAPPQPPSSSLSDRV